MTALTVCLSDLATEHLRVGILGKRHTNPGTTTSELGQMTDARGKRGDDLEARGALQMNASASTSIPYRRDPYQTDDTNLLVAPVLHILLPSLAAKIPVSGMDLDALELVQAVDVGPAQAAEDSNTSEEEIGDILELLKLALFLGGAFDGEVPLAGLLVITSGLEFVPDLDVRPELVFLGGTLQIFENLGTGGIEGRPIRLSVEHQCMLRNKEWICRTF